MLHTYISIARSFRFSFLLFLGLAIATHLHAQAIKADSALQAMVSNELVVGIAAGYSVDGITRWSNAAGDRCQASTSPFTARTLNRTASIAKPMTAVAIMQLVEKGLIDLDAPIQNYYSSFPHKEKGDITTRQLLTHTAGISQYQSTQEVENTTNYASLEEAVTVFSDRPLLFEPGSDFFYTTYGYVILGRIIEEVAGMSYEQYMQENIWEPAGMDHTGVEKTGQDYPDKACLYHRNKRKIKAADQNDLSNRVPGGGFYTNLEDMLRFGHALLDNSLIREETFNQMLEPGFPDKEGNQYGFGWFFYGPPPNQNVVSGHSGEQTGAANQLMIIPKSKTVVVVLSNTSGSWKEVVQYSSYLIQLSEK